MKKLFIFFVLFLIAILSKPTRLLALDDPYNIANCPGDIVVDAILSVHNDVVARKKGFGWNGVWAIKDYDKRIRIWKSSPFLNVYCTKVEDYGTFATLVGPSPQLTDPLIDVGIQGWIQGGYRTTYFMGDLLPIPSRPRKGDIGGINYGCSVTDPGDHSSCIDSFDWQSTYFSSIRYFDSIHPIFWSGWSYNTPSNGIWMDICDGRPPVCPGRSGDITD